jgi:drug/metabolite transporter (DMT)-like permease
MRPSIPFKSIISFIASVFLWGLSFVTAKIAVTEAGAFTVAAMRFALALLLLTPFVIKEVKSELSLFSPVFLFLGLLFAASFGLNHLALKFTSAGIGSLIFAGLPAAVVLISILLLKEQLTPYVLIGMILSVIGVLLATRVESIAGRSGMFLGNLMLVASVLAYALYVVLIKKYSMNHSSLVLTTASFAASLIYLVPISAGEIILLGLPEFSMEGILAILFLGFGASALAQSLWNYGLRFVKASTAAPFLNLLPVVGLWAAYLSGEVVISKQIIGGVIVILGVWVCTMGDQEGKDAAPV